MRTSNSSRARRILSSPVTLVLLVVAAGLFVISAGRVFVREQFIQKERNEAEMHTQTLKDRIRELEQELRITASGEAVERFAKEQLNLKVPGEEVVFVGSPGSISDQASSSNSSQIRVPGWMSQLFQFLVR